MLAYSDKKPITQLRHGNNLGYVLGDNDLFDSVDYKALQSRNDERYLESVKILCNGKIELLYLTEDYKPVVTQISAMIPDMIIRFMTGVFGCVIESENDGFLSCLNIDISFDHIFMDMETMMPKLVYIPVREKIYESVTDFEKELRRTVSQIICSGTGKVDARLRRFVDDVESDQMSLEGINKKYAHLICFSNEEKEARKHKYEINEPLKLIPYERSFPEIELKLNLTRIGIDKEWADIVIDKKGVSRKHCTIKKDGDEYYITDGYGTQGSTNGTYLDGKKLEALKPYPLKRGSELKFWDVKYMVR